jgi:radical SAM family uncharacterized protein/radical SAM-linked protein
VSVAVQDLITSDVLRPARYLGNERGAFHKPWEAAQVRWVLTYPEIYEVGASNLGHVILYNILNHQPRQLCDRAYLPAPDLAQKLRDTQTPLFAVESQRSLVDFDILGFSLSYELGATNILEMLSLAQIPLTRQARLAAAAAGHPYPLIFAGGQTATSNPEPYTDFLDFVAMGDGEELLPEIGLILEDGKAAGLDRTALLLDLAQIPGVYVPQFYDLQPDGSVKPNCPDVPEQILRRVATPIPHYSIGLVPYVETVHDRLVVEIRRGCTRGCRFCQPGMLTRPARDVEPEQVIDTIENGMRATGFNEFSLLSLSCSDYLALPAVGIEIRNRLKDDNISLSLPSQRVDRFDETIANVLGGTRQSSLTFAPEAGTQRLRDIINKGLTNEELLRGIQTAYDQGWDKVKLYFMIGLPGETDADVLGIAETVKWLQQTCYHPSRRRMSFTLTISNFTPKPHTPFQWHSVSTQEFKRKQQLLRDAFRPMKGVKVNFTDVRISAMEDFVGRGDRHLGPVLQRAWELGAGMDSWWESLDRAYSAWTHAIAEANLTWKYRQVEAGEWNVMEGGQPGRDFSDRLNAPLPWDHLDTGIDKKWLQDDLKNALAAAVVPDCSFDGCSHCGVCGPELGHNVVIAPLPIPTFVGDGKPDSQRVQRLRLRFGKLGTMALVSHLDLLRLLDRALRRAALPISFTGGFHPSPRIAIAQALSLGVTSQDEIMDCELATAMSATDFRDRLAEQLSSDLPLYSVEELDLKAPAASQLMREAAYELTLAVTQPDLKPFAWEQAIQQILDQHEIWYEQTQKSGKTKTVNLRDRLLDLNLQPTDGDVPLSGRMTLTYRGHCLFDGTSLKPSHVVWMLEHAIGYEVQLLKTHRRALILAPDSL